MSGSGSDVVEHKITWGKRSSSHIVLTKDYDSVFLSGQEICLYDFVYITSDGEPYVGCVIRLWQSEVDRSKNVRVRWMYRPTDVAKNITGIDRSPSCKELFLALGSGDDAEEDNDLGVVIGKCNCKILCPPEDADEDWQPEKSEIGKADFYISRCYDPDEEEVAVGVLELALNKMGVPGFGKQKKRSRQ